MPDRYDEELERLRSIDVPDQWDDISRRATVGPVQPSEPGALLGHRRISSGTCATTLLAAASAAAIDIHLAKTLRLTLIGLTHAGPVMPIYRPRNVLMRCVNSSTLLRFTTIVGTMICFVSGMNERSPRTACAIRVIA